jgi:hypothetical protein
MGAKGFKVIKCQSIPRKKELYVKSERRMTAREYESIPTQPLRITGVMTQKALEQGVGDWRERHGSSGMTITDLLHAVHGQRP